jgi:hypothetical protein
LRWIFSLAGILLIGNFFVLRAYGDTLRSTHLFIARGTVFYPVAWLNLVAGVATLAVLVSQRVKRPKQ